MVRINQPIPSPDWTKGLSEVYDRQTRQYTEDFQNKLQESAAIEQRDLAESNLKLFEGLLSTAKSGIAVYNKFNSPEKKVEKAKQLELDWFNEDPSKQTAYQLKLDKDLNDIKKDDEEGAKVLEKEITRITGKTLSKEEVHDIIEHYWSITGSEMTKYEQVLHSNFAKSITTQGFFSWAKDAPASHGKGKALADLEGLSLDDPAYRNYLNRYINEKTAQEAGNISDELKSTTFHEVERFLKTSSSSKKNSKNVAFHKGQTAHKISYLSNINVSATGAQKADHLQKWITRESKKFDTIKGGPTAIQQAVDSIKPHLVKMGEMRELDYSTWQDIREGLIDHPAAKNILQAFDKEGVFNTAVEEGIQRGIDLDYEEQKVLAKSQIQRGFLLAQHGELSETEYDALALRIKSLPRFENDDRLFDDFEKAFYNNRGEDTTQKDVAQFDPEVNKGNLTQDHVDSVAGTKANKILQDKYDLQERAKSRGNVKSKKDGLIGDVTNGKKGVLNLGKISSATNQVRDDILNFYDENFYAKVYAAGKDANFEILAAQSLAETKTYMEVNGFGKKTGDVGAGKFSSDGWSGEYTLYSQSYANTKITDDYLNANVKFNQADANLWDADIARTHEKPGYQKPKDRFAKADGLYTNGMLGHFLETGEISDQMLYIAKKNGLNISRAIGYSINAKLNSSSDEDKAFAKNFNIAQIKTKDWPDQTILDKGYDRVTVLQSGGKNAKDPLQLLAQAKTQGFDSLSKNQLQRLFVHLEGEELTGIKSIRYKLRQSGKSHEEIDKIFEDEIRRRQEQLIENTKYTKNYG